MKFFVCTLLIASIAVLVSNPVDWDSGEKGPKGDWGLPGVKGKPGLAGVVDYEKINATIKYMMKSAMEKHRAETNETINKLLARIETLEEHKTISAPSTLFPPPGIAEQDIVRYDGKIFIPLASEKIRKASAITKCQKLGGELANIFDQNHMNKIMTFIRDNKMNGQEYKVFWLGMTYDPINQILRFRNGTVISQSGFKWHRGFPLNGYGYSSFTNMCIRITENSAMPHQYIYNHSDYDRYALCEIYRLVHGTSFPSRSIP
ncbi:uncharacterized protein LOC144422837 [Styela clava]